MPCCELFESEQQNLGMDGCAANGNGDPESFKILLKEGSLPDSKSMQEISSVVEMLSKVELDLVYASEKLMNLEALLLLVFTWQNDFNTMTTTENDTISLESMEKALIIELLSSILDSEVTVLSNFLGELKVRVIDVRQNFSSSMQLGDFFCVIECKLQDSEESLKQSQEHVLEMKMQLAKLHMNSFTFNHHDWKYNWSTGLYEGFQTSNKDIKPQRHILRMLEKSLSREMDLDKKIAQFKQNEEDLKLKLRLTEQVALCMEEAAEVVWGRFLEAENVASVLMGISKEMVGQVQLLQFNLNSLIKKEEEMKSTQHLFSEQLKDKDTAIDQLKNSITQIISDCSEVSILRENVKLLEEELIASESQLQKANEHGKECQEQISEMDSLIESLKENIYAAESRTEHAEAKVTQLTETNLELTEEMNFLKSSNDSNTKKVSVLEKQIRELEFQLQHSRASSEASQEQQTMLYSAIWDMETLIDELRQKVSKAESKTQNEEEQCLTLSEANMELNKEIEFLRTRMGCLEASLNQANDEKLASAKDINVNSGLIMDMVMQLATERKRIKNQLYSLAEENRLLRFKLQNTKEDATKKTCENGLDGVNDVITSGLNSSNSIHAEPYKEVGAEISSKSLQVEEFSQDDLSCNTDATSSIPADNGTVLVMKPEGENVVVGGIVSRRSSRKYTVTAVLVLLLSMLIPYTLSKKYSFLSLYRL